MIIEICNIDYFINIAEFNTQDSNVCLSLYEFGLYVHFDAGG